MSSLDPETLKTIAWPVTLLAFALFYRKEVGILLTNLGWLKIGKVEFRLKEGKDYSKALFWLTKGEIFEELREYDQSLTHYHRAIIKDKKMSVAYTSIARVHLKKAKMKNDDEKEKRKLLEESRQFCSRATESELQFEEGQGHADIYLVGLEILYEQLILDHKELDEVACQKIRKYLKEAKDMFRKQASVNKTEQSIHDLYEKLEEEEKIRTRELEKRQEKNDVGEHDEEIYKCFYTKILECYPDIKVY